VALSKGLDEKQVLIDKLSQSFDVLDMSNNSIAKTHIRYMVGGRADLLHGLFCESCAILSLQGLFVKFVLFYHYMVYL
jgi:hypothetical protein